MNFMLMVAIIVLSFTNFFYVVERNLALSRPDSDPYYEPYVGNDVLDALISVYLMGALGDFDTEVYRSGWDRYAAMAMFLLATFFICVVFMNMLIAIMGETFGRVTAAAQESGLQE